MVLRGSVYSNTLNMETGLSVITPNDYGQAEKYKVCYVLHGLCGGSADFSNYTMLPYYAYDKNIIFICPEVHRSFYSDTEYGMNYFRFVSEELPHLAKLVFNISSEPCDTAVMGCSMGGYGALKCALNYPDKFGFCGAFSPAPLFLKEYAKSCVESGKTDLPELLKIFGENLNIPPRDDIPSLVAKVSELGKMPKIYIAVGDRDMFLEDNRRMSEIMKNSGLELVYEEINGEHDFYAFNEGIKRAVEIFSGIKPFAKAE